jgi:hypothetical protein
MDLEGGLMHALILALAFIGFLYGQADPENRSRPATKPGQMIPVSESDVRIIHRAAQILSDETKWNRKDNRICPTEANTWSLYCALYLASVEINGKFDHRLGALEEVRRSVEQVSPRQDLRAPLNGLQQRSIDNLRCYHERSQHDRRESCGAPAALTVLCRFSLACTASLSLVQRPRPLVTTCRRFGFSPVFSPW